MKYYKWNLNLVTSYWNNIQLTGGYSAVAISNISPIFVKSFKNFTPYDNTASLSNVISDQFAIYLVQRSSATLAPNFKMAASFSVEEVLQMVVRGEEMEIDDDEVANEEVSLADRIKECLKEVGSASIDVDFFVNAGVSMLLPLYDLSWRRVESLPAVACQILNTQIQVATIMRSESRLWLEAIHRRLAARRRVRNPFQSEIGRDIPYEFFRALLRITKSTGGFAEPFVSFGANRKEETISFSSLRPAKQLFSLLSGLTEREVVQHFKRTLTGKKAGSKVNVIASEEKKMFFVYKLTKGQLLISFHFGEWNTYGFPQHN